jgi:anti-anti-sigma factor
MILQTNFYTLEPDLTVLALSGRLSLGTASQSLEWKLQEMVRDGVRKLVVDVEGLHSIDSAGVGILVMVAGQIAESGGSMRVSGASGGVAKTFEVVHLARIVPLCADLAGARAELA